jgi:hypothetical protein
VIQRHFEEYSLYANHYKGLDKERLVEFRAWVVENTVKSSRQLRRGRDLGMGAWMGLPEQRSNQHN